MAALHAALQALGPCNFADIPNAADELNALISDLFAKTEMIVESVPISPPEDTPLRLRSATISSTASTSSQMSSSSERSAPPAPEHAALQKVWGKPVKVSDKGNPLNIQVYKLGGKDGRGSWFARRSVHDGLGFARFKRGLEREFPESIKVQGGPGEGNIRGIGGERRVEEIQVEGKGKVEVYHLSAQFPGPTAPRDFVTFLVTSSKGMTETHKSEVREISPRHYMIISKPCNHPACPPRDGMVRGQYESVEFIREVPRKQQKIDSSTSLKGLTNEHGGKNSPNPSQEALLQNARQKVYSFPLHHENKSATDLTHHDHDQLRIPETTKSDRLSSPTGRSRAATVGLSDGHVDRSKISHHSELDDYDPEDNPVEWIMITRSDPGGGIPRFMVERGTPSSIVADAYKFLEWACQQDEPSYINPNKKQSIVSERRDSFESWRANGTLSGINENENEQKAIAPSATDERNVAGAVSSTLSQFAPQVLLDHLPAQTPTDPTRQDTETEPFPLAEDDAKSSISSTSFASADSHLDDTDDPSLASSSLTSPHLEKNDSGILKTPHEKELAKLAQRRATLDKKLASAREKLVKDNENQTAKEKEAIKKAEEKHEKELRRQEERHQKELAKLDEKKKKEARKLEDKRRKQADKDEKARLTREWDEARAEIEILKQEREIWQKQVGDLQRENTRLTARVGKLEAMDGKQIKHLIEEERAHGGRSRGLTSDGSSDGVSSGTRSRSASLRKFLAVDEAKTVA